MLKLLIIAIVGGILSGCDGVSSDQFDKATGTFCLQEERLSEIEKRLKIKVPDEKKMKCKIFTPQYGTAMDVRVK